MYKFTQHVALVLNYYTHTNMPHAFFLLFVCVFSVITGLAMRILSVRPSVRLSVRPSVRLSVTRVIPDKMEERSVQIFKPYERTFSLVF